MLDMSPDSVSEPLESKFCGLCFTLAFMHVYIHMHVLDT